MVAALRHDRMTAPMTLNGAMTGDAFRSYIGQVLRPTLRRGDIVVMDNVPLHRTQAVREALERLGVSVPTFTGSSGVVTHPRLPQNVACRFAALRSSGVGSQYCESLQRLVGQPQLWSQQRDLLLELIEVGPGEAPGRPAAATKHPTPVTLDVPVHLLQCTEISGNAVESVVTA